MAKIKKCTEDISQFLNKSESNEKRFHVSKISKSESSDVLNELSQTLDSMSGHYISKDKRKYGVFKELVTQ